MTKKTRILFIPGFYSSAYKECVDTYLHDANSILKQIDVEYTETTALSDLDSATAIAKQAKEQDYDTVLLYLISWVDINVVVDLFNKLGDKPCIIWSVDYFMSGERKSHLGALAALLPIKGSLEQMKTSFSYLYGNPDKEGLPEELAAIIQASRAVSALAQSRIGMVGYTALGMYPGMVNPMRVKKLLGTEIVPIDNYTLIEQCKTNLKDQSLLQENKSLLQGLTQLEPLSEKDINTCIAMTTAIRQLTAQHGLSAITLRCCFELASDFGFAPCVPLSILSDECVSSCESDIPVTLTQLILQHLGQKPAPYVDVMLMDQSRIYCACCGFGAFAYARDAKKCIAYSDTNECKSEFSFARVINTSRYKDAHYTLARLNFPLEEEPFMQVITGENKNDFDAFYEFGCKEYPSLGLTVNQPTDQILSQLTSQHLALIEGNISDKLQRFCNLINIEMKLLS